MPDAISGSATQPHTEAIRRSFWEDTGENFPSLAGAPSTRYYLACEQGFFERFTPDLWLYVRRPWTRYIMAPLIAPFAFLYRASALIRRQGYLIFAIARKPG